MKRRVHLYFALAVAIPLLMPTSAAPANDLAKVSCDGFPLAFDGQADSKECMTADAAKGRGEGDFSQLQVRTK